MMTAREMIAALAALPDIDAPVFIWMPGQYFEPEGFFPTEDVPSNITFTLLEANVTSREEIIGALK